MSGDGVPGGGVQPRNLRRIFLIWLFIGNTKGEILRLNEQIFIIRMSQLTLRFFREVVCLQICSKIISTLTLHDIGTVGTRVRIELAAVVARVTSGLNDKLLGLLLWVSTSLLRHRLRSSI